MHDELLARGRLAGWDRAPGWRQQFREALPLALLALGVGVGLGVGVAAATPLYALGGLLGIAFLAALLSSADLGLLALVGVITLLPYGVIPVPIGSVRLTVLDLTLSALLLTWVLRLLGRREERLILTPLGAWVLGFLGLACTSFLLGTAYASSPETTRLFLKLINSVLVFFTIANVVRTGRQIAQLIRALVAGAGVAALLGAALYALPNGTAAQLLGMLRPFGYPAAGEALRFIASTETERAISTSIDPNVLGALLSLAGVLAASQLLAESRWRSRLWLGAALLAILVCLLLTYSRSSWIGLVAGLGFIAMLRHRRLVLLFVGAGVAIYLFAAPAENQFLTHLESGLAARDQAAAMRLGEYKDALQLISQYPWFGVGFGKAPDVDLYIGVSSIYLLMAEEMGLIGLSTFLGTMAALYLTALRALMATPDRQIQSLGLGCLAALAAALTIGLLDHHFFNIRFPHVVTLFWLLAGLAVAAARLAEADRSPQRQYDPSLRG